MFETSGVGFKVIVRGIWKFTSGRIATLIVEEIILLVFITWLEFNSMTVKLLAEIVVILLNYMVSKFWCLIKRESRISMLDFEKQNFHMASSEKIKIGRFEVVYDTIEQDGNKYPYSYVKMKRGDGVLGGGLGTQSYCLDNTDIFGINGCGRFLAAW